MAINFHDQRNRLTYATRIADETWKAFIRSTIDVTNKQVADIGCGGGIYTKALLELGAAHVTAVDFSEEMLKSASHNCKDMQNVTFLLGDAYYTKLPGDKMDIVLERALIHHLNNLDACFREAWRILKNGGTFIIQDRTPQDCMLPGDEQHIRGYFFEKFPALLEKEIARRHESHQIQQALMATGFRLMKTTSLWETRRVYQNRDALVHDLSLRTGRSILHALTDTELQELISFIHEKIDDEQFPITEKDAWTIWIALKE